MTKITTLDLTPFYRASIGVDRLFNRIVNQIDTTTTTNYPPYNIVKTGDNTFEIQVAVAGFTQGELEVNFHDGQLIVTGEKKTIPNPDHVYHHQGISARKFMRTWPLVDYMEVIDAVAKDGILTVSLEQRLPEAMKPKAIAITYQS